MIATKRRRPEPATLNLKQQRFVSEFLKDLNGSAAAIRAGYSQRTADVQAYALLRKPQIAKLIAAGEAERLAANKITATRTLEEDRRIAFNDPRRFVTADGNLQPILNWTDGGRRGQDRSRSPERRGRRRAQRHSREDPVLEQRGPVRR